MSRWHYGHKPAKIGDRAGVGVSERYEAMLKAVYPNAHVVHAWNDNGVKLIATFEQGSPIAYLMTEEADAYIFRACGYADIVIRK